MRPAPHTRFVWMAIGLLMVVSIGFQAAVSVPVFTGVVKPSAYPTLPFRVQFPGGVLSGEPSAADTWRAGDRLVAVNGRPIKGFSDLMRPLANLAVGAEFRVTLERDGKAFETVAAMQGLRDEAWGLRLSAAILSLFTPWFCIVLSFFVLLQRPFDRLAWLLTGMLLGFGQIATGTNHYEYFWPVPLAIIGITYSTLAFRMFAAAILNFGMDFPDPASPKRMLGWIRWPATIVIGFTAVLQTATRIGWLLDGDRFSSVIVLGRRLEGMFFWEMSFGIGLFFMNIGFKLGTEKAPDAKRRLLFLMRGAFVSLTPILLVLVAARLGKGGNIAELPDWLWLPAISMLFLFPLTLAYVIVVEKAMDVSVVLRQGLRYALASHGVELLRVGLIALAVYWSLEIQQNMNLMTVQKVFRIALIVAAAVLARRGADQVRQWVDRFFFREAVRAEHLLAELSEQVRGIPDTPTLIKIAAGRIGEALHVQQVDITLNGAAPPQAELALPLLSGQKRLGYLALGPKRNEEPYSTSDRRLLESVAAQMALAIENQRLTETVAHEAAQRERIHRELEIARDVQERLFPSGALRLNGVEAAGRCRPAQSIGGDYYDYFDLGGDALCFAVGDVSGKGIPAALLMASLQSSLRGLQHGGVLDPAALMEKLNLLLWMSTARSRFATLFYGVYTPSTRQVRYASAGHHASIVLRAGGTIELLSERGIALGLTRQTSYPQGAVSLHPGDTLIAYSDGISEAMTEARDDFGEERLLESARAVAGLPLAEVLDRIFAAVDAFTGAAPQHDDMTLVVVRAV